MSRRTEDGRDIGADYQRQCIASWREAGFTEIISVNSKEEIETSAELQNLARDLGVRIVPVERDALTTTRKRLIFLTDLLQVARESAVGGKFAFINADIALVQDANVLDLISCTVRPKRFLMARRAGINDPDGQSGDLYYWGFDLFAAHTSDIEAMPDMGLVIGAPWWDYYFPIMMCLRGAEPAQPVMPAILHLEHDERWDSKVWHELGQSSLNAMLSLLSRAPLSSDVKAADYAAALHRAFQRKTGNMLSDLAYHTRKLLPKYARQELEKALKRVAHTNVKFLDRYKTLVPPSKEAKLLKA